MIAQTYNWTLISNCLAGNVCVFVSNYSGCWKAQHTMAMWLTGRTWVHINRVLRTATACIKLERTGKFPAVSIRNVVWWPTTGGLFLSATISLPSPTSGCWVWNLYASPHLRHCLKIFPNWRANDCDGKETRMKGPASGWTRTGTGAMCLAMCTVPPRLIHSTFCCSRQLFYNLSLLACFPNFFFLVKKTHMDFRQNDF